MAQWTRQQLQELISNGQPLPSLNGADLIDQDLSGLDLARADLSYAHFEGADLSEATLRGAILFGAKGSGSCLRRADLRNTNLTAADLSQSDLTEALLDGANLSGTNLSGAWGVDRGSLAVAGAIAHADADKEIRIDPTTRAAPVDLHTGDVLRIDVVQPAGGYQWAVVEPPDPVLDAAEPERHERTAEVREGQGPLGAEAAVTLRFRARRPGQVSLRLVLARQWEHGEPLNEVAVDVRVLPTPALPASAPGEGRRRKG
ncbi:pentapeptide repeat-containing protein [Mycetocola miduiensis]|uniref:Chagasin family peptidase inhibitor I42 n=1 Tax=Mycetocola miduiensis TaxID=995034 RepID=A0A1I5CTL6_9MICO|nr:pentapeptide repeat-containing protein [Mycetocola miduiensis]SFN90320.1 Chagasin family peptidase inhibitor I42 [Mycetocola miduiensis]